MSKQLYGYASSYAAGERRSSAAPPSSAYPNSYTLNRYSDHIAAAEPYIPPLAARDTSPIYSTPRGRLRLASADIAKVGSAAASARPMTSSYSQTPWNGVENASSATADLTYKRPVEALYHHTGHNNEALYSTNYLVKRPKFETASTLPIFPQRPGKKDCTHYMRTRTCKFDLACKFDHPVWVPEGGIPDWQELPLPSSTESPPDRPGEPDCPYYMKTQKCKFGNKCKFNHPKGIADGSTGVTEGKRLSADNNSEVYADSMTEKDLLASTPALIHNSKGLPIRPGEQDCTFYMKMGSCKYGAACRYNHPDRNTFNPSLAADAANLFTPSSLSLGIFNSAANILPNITAFTHPSLGAALAIYPQRPGETLCDFYMKNRICKFGERCKFHHPIDRSTPIPAAVKPTEQNVKLTLAGLPRREGCVSCPYYMKTGACKYGASCKFDHPSPGEAVAMATKQSTGTENEATVAGTSLTEGCISTASADGGNI